jgi:hypothetical protein
MLLPAQTGQEKGKATQARSSPTIEPVERAGSKPMRRERGSLD